MSLRKDVLALNPSKPLSLGHYNLVAALDEEQQRAWLSQAALRGWSVAQLHVALRTEPKPALQPLWERAYEGMRRALLRCWKTMPSGERQRLRQSLLALLDELEALDSPEP